MPYVLCGRQTSWMHTVALWLGMTANNTTRSCLPRVFVQCRCFFRDVFHSRTSLPLWWPCFASPQHRAPGRFLANLRIGRFLANLRISRFLAMLGIGRFMAKPRIGRFTSIPTIFRCKTIIMIGLWLGSGCRVPRSRRRWRWRWRRWTLVCTSWEFRGRFRLFRCRRWRRKLNDRLRRLNTKPQISDGFT